RRLVYEARNTRRISGSVDDVARQVYARMGGQATLGVSEDAFVSQVKAPDTLAGGHGGGSVGVRASKGSSAGSFQPQFIRTGPGTGLIQSGVPIEPSQIEVMLRIHANLLRQTSSSDKSSRPYLMLRWLDHLEEYIDQLMMAARAWLDQIDDYEFNGNETVLAYLQRMQEISQRLSPSVGSSVGAESVLKNWNRVDGGLTRQYSQVSHLIQQRLPAIMAGTDAEQLVEHVLGEQNLLWPWFADEFFCGREADITSSDIEGARREMLEIIGESGEQGSLFRYLIAMHLALKQIALELRAKAVPDSAR
ncbi:MAG: hypothetical protein ACK5PW_05915, partial [Burkholderiales bacterium]